MANSPSTEYGGNNIVMEKKIELLNLLEKDSRLSPAELAKLLGVEEDAVRKLIKELESEGVIRGYTSIINWDKVSEEKVNALIEVKAVPQRGVGFDKLALRIAKFDEVDSIYLLSGGFDFMIEIKGRSMREVSSFVFEKLSTLEDVHSTATHFLLKKYKDHGVLMEKESKDPREKVVL